MLARYRTAEWVREGFLEEMVLEQWFSTEGDFVLQGRGPQLPDRGLVQSVVCSKLGHAAGGEQWASK